MRLVGLFEVDQLRPALQSQPFSHQCLKDGHHIGPQHAGKETRIQPRCTECDQNMLTIVSKGSEAQKRKTRP